jgi:hypothetical protein
MDDMDDMDGMDWMMAVTAGVGDYFAFWTVQGEGRWGRGEFALDSI